MTIEDVGSVDITVVEVNKANGEWREPSPEQSIVNGGDGVLARLQSYLDYHNIAVELSEDELGSIGDRVFREYQIDESSRAAWMDKMGRAMDLALQVTDVKQYPFPNAANVKYPLLTSAAVQFAARAYPAIVPGQNIVKGKVVGSDKGVPLMGPRGPVLDPNTGQPVWQVTPGNKKDRADRVASHISYQLTEEMEEWEEDTDRLLHTLAITGCMFRKTWYDTSDGKAKSEAISPRNLIVNQGATSLDRAPRITHEFQLYPYEVDERIRANLYLDVEIGLTVTSGDDEQAPHKFLEQHRWLDLDNDGFLEPYIVTIHKETAQIVRLVARFDAEGIKVNPENQQIIRIEPIQCFTKYGFIRDPDGGFYDIGFGLLLGPINRTVNSILNALLDAGHLQNTGGGFMRGDLRISGQSSGKIMMRPGEYRKVESPGGNIRDAVFPIQHPGPSVVLFQLLGLLINAGKEIASVQDVMTGEMPRQQTATTTLALIEQGMKVFSAIYKRVHRSLKHELRKLYRLNRLYLEDQVYFQVMDEEQAIAREDYGEGVDIVPVSDPTVVSDMQQMARAEFVLGFRGDPFVNQRAIRERAFDAVLGPEDTELLVTSPQPDPAAGMEAEERAIRLGMDQKKLEHDLSLDSDRCVAEIAERHSKIIRNLAEAESKEAGIQLQSYNVIMKNLVDRVAAQKGRGYGDDGANTGGVRGVETAPDNQGRVEIPRRPPQGPIGGLG
jgi:chaperonin GroES